MRTTLLAMLCGVICLGPGSLPLAAGPATGPQDSNSNGIPDFEEARRDAIPREDANAAGARGAILGVGFSFVNSPVYRIDEETGAGVLVGLSGCPALNSLARDSSGTFFSISGGFLVTIDPLSGACTVVTPVSLGEVSGGVLALAVAPDDGLYALKRRIVGEISPIDLYTIDVATGLGALVGPTEQQRITSLEFSSSGELYGWDLLLGLVLIDPATGAVTDPHPSTTGELVQSLAFAPGGRLFGAWESLWEIDPADGSQHVVGSGDYADVRGIAFELPALVVGLDIKPGSFPNPVHPGSRGVLSVALMGSAEFDVSDVNPATLRFGPAGAAPAHDLTDGWTRNEHLRDLNLDGFMDLVLHFHTQETGVSCADATMALTGRRLDNRRFEGTDSIRTVGCGDRSG